MYLTRILWLVHLMSICLGIRLPNEAFESHDIVNKHNLNEADDNMIRRIEEEMLALNNSGNMQIRDKRALGILLQGFMEALGYTVSPIQIASITNPTPVVQMPGSTSAPAPSPMGPTAMMPRMMGASPMPSMMPTANKSASPRQRETVRITGVLSFGNNLNTSNLVNHLAQYEQLFHPRNMTSTAPPPVPTSSTGPRAQEPLLEPFFVKIPLPMAPNLAPPMPPSPNPEHISFHEEEYSSGHSEEYRGSNEDLSHRGESEQENENSHYREEYENKQEQFDQPENRKKTQKPKSFEKHYTKNENVVNYSVEKKEIHDPKHVSEERPIVGNNYNHAVYADEPNWKQAHEDHVYRIATEQEAKAEALAEENAEREKNKSHRHEYNEPDEEFQRSREQEIRDHDEEQVSRFEAGSKKRPNYNDEEDEEEESNEKQPYGDEGEGLGGEDDYEEESKISERSRESRPNVVAAERFKYNEVNAVKSGNRRYEQTSSEESVESRRYDVERKELRKEEGGKPRVRLPISYDREKSREGQPIRDSYGKSLEKPGEKVDDRLAGYFTIFKNPNTGVYDPERIQEYENSRKLHGNPELVSVRGTVREKYEFPENKYEEYELDDYEDEIMEHREGPGPTNPALENHEEEIGENESRKNTKKISPDYGPYHSSFKRLYDPRDYNRRLISRLTSHDAPTTVEPERRVEEPTSTQLTGVALPQRLTTMSLSHEAETKEISAWPAPFDYVFDNSEHKDIIFDKALGRNLESSTSRLAALGQTGSNCYEQAHSLPPGDDADRIEILLKEHERNDLNIGENKISHRQRTNDPRLNGRTVLNKRVTKTEYLPTQLTTQSSFLGQRKRLVSTDEKFESINNQRDVNQASTNTPIHPGLSKLQSIGITRNTKAPIRNPIFISRFVEKREKNKRIPRIKSTASEKYDDYLAPMSQNTSEKSSSYFEKNNIVIIPEPSPQYRNTRYHEDSNEPTSGIDRVHSEKFRNKIVPVKDSEMKQLRPEQLTQMTKYHHRII